MFFGEPNIVLPQHHCEILMFMHNLQSFSSLKNTHSYMFSIPLTGEHSDSCVQDAIARRVQANIFDIIDPLPTITSGVLCVT